MSSAQERHEKIVGALARATPAPVVHFPLTAPLVSHLDLSLENPIIANADIQDNSALTAIIDQLITRVGAQYGIGGYDEKRGWYARGEQFSQGEEIRSIHLGVDIWAPAGTPVFSPFDAIVHSAQDNALYGDYGPTVILEHTLDDETFYTLFGHLSRESLEGKLSGTRITRGAHVGTIGAPPTNGDWPPHLHFQIINDMLGKLGDYPGVAADSQRAHFLTLCPNPNYILRSPLLP